MSEIGGWKGALQDFAQESTSSGRRSGRSTRPSCRHRCGQGASPCSPALPAMPDVCAQHLQADDLLQTADAASAVPGDKTSVFLLLLFLISPCSPPCLMHALNTCRQTGCCSC